MMEYFSLTFLIFYIQFFLILFPYYIFRKKMSDSIFENRDNTEEESQNLDPGTQVETNLIFNQEEDFIQKNQDKLEQKNNASQNFSEPRWGDRKDQLASPNSSSLTYDKKQISDHSQRQIPEDLNKSQCQNKIKTVLDEKNCIQGNNSAGVSCLENFLLQTVQNNKEKQVAERQTQNFTTNQPIQVFKSLLSHKSMHIHEVLMSFDELQTTLHQIRFEDKLSIAHKSIPELQEENIEDIQKQEVDYLYLVTQGYYKPKTKKIYPYETVFPDLEDQKLIEILKLAVEPYINGSCLKQLHRFKLDYLYNEIKPFLKNVPKHLIKQEKEEGNHCNKEASSTKRREDNSQKKVSYEIKDFETAQKEVQKKETLNPITEIQTQGAVSFSRRIHTPNKSDILNKEGDSELKKEIIDSSEVSRDISPISTRREIKQIKASMPKKMKQEEQIPAQFSGRTPESLQQLTSGGRNFSTFEIRKILSEKLEPELYETVKKMDDFQIREIYESVSTLSHSQNEGGKRQSNPLRLGPKPKKVKVLNNTTVKRKSKNKRKITHYIQKIDEMLQAIRKVLSSDEEM